MLNHPLHDSLYTIGLDYGSLSCRGILADVRNGSIHAEETFVYPHGVMDASLPDGTPLQSGWYLQHPSDYVDALQALIPSLVKKSGVSPPFFAFCGLNSILICDMILSYLYGRSMPVGEC